MGKLEAAGSGAAAPDCCLSNVYPTLGRHLLPPTRSRGHNGWISGSALSLLTADSVDCVFVASDFH